MSHPFRDAARLLWEHRQAGTALDALPAPLRPHDGSGLTIKLPDERSVSIQLPPELIDRMLTVITAEELEVLVEVIAHAVADAGSATPGAT